MIFLFVYMDTYLYFQVQILLVISFFNIIYLTTVKPLATNKMNRTELANEVSIMFIMNMINILINPEVNPTFRNYTGYVICIVATLNMSINLFLTMFFGV